MEKRFFLSKVQIYCILTILVSTVAFCSIDHSIFNTLFLYSFYNNNLIYQLAVMALCIDLSTFSRIVWHFIAFAQYAISMYYDLNYVKAPKHLSATIVRPGMGGRSRYLTYWCLVSGKLSASRNKVLTEM